MLVSDSHVAQLKFQLEPLMHLENQQIQLQISAIAATTVFPEPTSP